VLSRTDLPGPRLRSDSNPRSFKSLPPLRISFLSFFDSPPFFSIACSLFPQNAGVGRASRSGLWTLGGSRRRLLVPEMLLRDTRGGVSKPNASPSPSLALFSMPSRISLTSSTSLASYISISFRINTCKSVSKQTTLTSFRMNTYEKPGGGGYPNEPPIENHQLLRPRPQHLSSAPRNAAIPCALTRLRILLVTTGVYPSRFVVSSVQLPANVVGQQDFLRLCASADAGKM